MMTDPSTGPAASSDLCPWNKGKSGAQLDLTSLITPRLQILKVDHTMLSQLHYIYQTNPSADVI